MVLSTVRSTYSAFYVQCVLRTVWGSHPIIYPHFTRGRLWRERGSVMARYHGLSVQTKNIFEWLKSGSGGSVMRFFRFLGGSVLKKSVLGGLLWDFRFFGDCYLKVWVWKNQWNSEFGGSVMRFLVRIFDFWGWFCEVSFKNQWKLSLGVRLWDLWNTQASCQKSETPRFSNLLITDKTCATLKQR